MKSPRDRAGRWYALLLHAYPRPYRDRFATAMRETFATDHRQVASRGRLPLLAFWSVTIGQAVWFGLLERMRRSGRAGASDLSRPGPRRVLPRLGADGRHALRLMARSPLFTVTSILSIAIGTTASATIFGLGDAMFFQAAPGVREAHRLVDIERRYSGRGHGTFSYPEFRHLREHSRTLASMTVTAGEPVPVSMTDGPSSERVYATIVSGTYFDVLGVRPALGRFFGPSEDDVPGQHPAAVLTHEFWTERFGADPSVLERQIRINGRDVAVVGVAAPGFHGATIMGTDVWVPAAMLGVVRGSEAVPQLRSPAVNWVRATGRMRPGVRRAEAETELNVLLENFKAAHPDVLATAGIGVAGHGRLPVSARAPFGTFVGLLFLLAAGLLAIACSNVGGMLLARTTGRQREMATRLALGAGRRQLVAQMLVETVLLFAAAGLVALPLVTWILGGVDRLIPQLPVPIHFEAAVTMRTLGFAAGICLATAVLFGLAPARQALKQDVARLLHGQSSTPGRDRRRLRQGLVVAQLALSLAITITGGLFVRSLHAASRIDTGYRTEGVTIVSLDTTLAGASGGAATDLMERVVRGIEALPGIEAVGHSRMMPMQGASFRHQTRVPGASGEVRKMLSATDWDMVSPGYFRAVGLPILEGRGVAAGDLDGGPLVAVVNQTFARIAWPGRSAVGQQLHRVRAGGADGRPMRVVGVVKDARTRRVGEPARPFVYVPFAQHPEPTVELFVKHAPEQHVAADVRRIVSAIEPGLPIVRTQPFAEAVGLELFPQRVAAWTAGAVGVIGMFLAALGLYGLAAFLVAQRAREIAIRMALGASGTQVRAMVLRQAAKLGIIGVAVGLMMAWGLGRMVQSLNLLVDVRPFDPITFIGVSAVMTGVLLTASYLPARRAASTEPSAALRAQ